MCKAGWTFDSCIILYFANGNEIAPKRPGSWFKHWGIRADARRFVHKYIRTNDIKRRTCRYSHIEVNVGMFCQSKPYREFSSKIFFVITQCEFTTIHYDVIKWKKIRVTGPLCVWTNCWVKNRDAGDSRHHRAHYDVTVFFSSCSSSLVCKPHCTRFEMHDLRLSSSRVYRVVCKKNRLLAAKF